MYTLDRVIKEFKSIIRDLKKEQIPRNLVIRYYEIIIEYLLLENKYKEIVELSGKPIYIYFKYSLPVYNTEYFQYLYNPYNPVRFAVETFDSIEEVRLELKNGK